MRQLKEVEKILLESTKILETTKIYCYNKIREGLWEKNVL